MNENDVVEAVVGGNINRYEILVRRYHIGLILHCEHLVGDRDTAEDIAQETFIKAFNKLEGFNPERSRFSTWLYKIATNKALDHLRAAKRTVPEQDVDSIVDESTPDYEAEEAKLEIRTAVAKLQPPSHRRVIEAYYWEGQSYQSIADSLKVPINTVRTWLRRAKQQLRSELS